MMAKAASTYKTIKLRPAGRVLAALAIIVYAEILVEIVSFT
jgi:hypothetical protein